MQYRRIIKPFAFLKSEKDERKLTTHPLPIFRIADPEDNVKCSVAVWTTVHTILGESRKILYTLYGIAKIEFVSIHMVFVYEINRVFIFKTLRQPLIFLGAIYIFYSLLKLLQGLFHF